MDHDLSPGKSLQCTDHTSAAAAATNATCHSSSGGQATSELNLHICPSTGGQFDIRVNKCDTVDVIKRAIAKKVKIPKEKFNILYKERTLSIGSIEENSICDGGNIMLVPQVETGLASQRPDQTVMQALESLSDTQVNEFLAGKSPLTLAMRLGDHMMFVQLQLSTPASKRNKRRQKRLASSHHHHSHSVVASKSSASSSSASVSAAAPGVVTSSSAMSDSNATVLADTPRKFPGFSTASSHASGVLPGSSSAASNMSAVPSSSSTRQNTPIIPTMPVHTTLLSHHHNVDSSSMPHAHSNAPDSDCVSSSKTATVRQEAVRTSHTGMPEADIHLPTLDSAALTEATRNLSKRLKELSKITSSQNETVVSSQDTEAVASDNKNKRQAGAIIESMLHHGQGVYSGTFSGTLNPALQDKDGKPRKSLSTIIHILNDLLGAQPQYRAHVSSQKRDREMHKNRPLSQSEAEAMDTANDEIKSQENQMTREKIEQLKLIMKEKHERRIQRQASRGPYDWRQHKTTERTVSSSSLDDSNPMEVDANVEVADEVTDSQYGSISHETVIV